MRACMLVHKSCLTVCDPMINPPDPVHGISQARTLRGMPFPSPGHKPVLTETESWEVGELRTVNSKRSPVLDLNLMLVTWCLYSSCPQNSVLFISQETNFSHMETFPYGKQEWELPKIMSYGICNSNEMNNISYSKNNSQWSLHCFSFPPQTHFFKKCLLNPFGHNEVL